MKYIPNRFTPDLIRRLEPNEIFVFGSNEGGIHGAGAARIAVERYGAIFKIPEGLQGKTYAIPTKDKMIKTLRLLNIKSYVDKFIEFAKTRPDLTFLVTKIGCGLAGYTESQIAPLFSQVLEEELNNIILPEEFVNHIISNP